MFAEDDREGSKSGSADVRPRAAALVGTAVVCGPCASTHRHAIAAAVAPRALRRPTMFCADSAVDSCSWNFTSGTTNRVRFVHSQLAPSQ